jgi:hypothetical protein
LKVALNTITITPLIFSCKYNPHAFLLISSILGKLLLLLNLFFLLIQTLDIPIFIKKTNC